jgi:acetate kinase
MSETDDPIFADDQRRVVEYQVRTLPSRRTAEARAHGTIDRIGLSGTKLTFDDPAANHQDDRELAAADHKPAANFLMDSLEEQEGFGSVLAVGHRVVHGMQRSAPELVTPELLDELPRVSPFDPDSSAKRDRADRNSVPALLVASHPTPLWGVQRYGFHGWSYAYLTEELARLGDPAATVGRTLIWAMAQAWPRYATVTALTPA